MKPELTRLYSLLGLPQDCSLGELQLAYRRRISQLQPRARGAETLTAEDAALLRELISLYTAANRFHRRHGRLPGAEPNRGAARPGNFRAPVETRHAPLPVVKRTHRTQRNRPELGLFGIIMLLLLSLALFAIWALVAAYIAGEYEPTAGDLQHPALTAWVSGSPVETARHPLSAAESSDRTPGRDS